MQVGGGRTLPKLLFVTNQSKLVANIGTQEAADVLRSVAAAGAVLYLPDGISTAAMAASHVRSTLASKQFEGVVILGGYDVVPADRLDVLDPATRAAIVAAGYSGQDADDFIVWNDDLYADVDGDRLPELPLSRIPDARSANLVRAALGAIAFSVGSRFGVRNLHREFAAEVFDELVPGQGDLNVSEPFSPSDVTGGVTDRAVYLMLHGSARDASQFWGERRSGAAIEAIAVENISSSAPGAVIYTGCCWGSLAMSPTAALAKATTPLRPRNAQDSIAMAFLNAGALAFVGCTGSHYSPIAPPFDYFGGPMHVAFWKELRKGHPPAKALFLAKESYASRIPHGRNDIFSRAVELKILRQYACLGLGW